MTNFLIFYVENQDINLLDISMYYRLDLLERYGIATFYSVVDSNCLIVISSGRCELEVELVICSCIISQ